MEDRNIISIRKADIYQREALILANVNLDIEKGSFVYLIGRVGSGKTSLIKTLNAEIPLVNGEVTVAGFKLSDISQREIPFLRRKIGVVFQDFKLLTDRNVHDNLAFVLQATGWKQTKAIEDRIDDMLELVAMRDKLKVMPHELSGGEQQHVVIARALLNDPDVILADEPTGNLDPETSQDLLRIFLELNERGKTIVMATHDYPLVRQFPARTLICEHKQVKESPDNVEEIDFMELLEM
ncbi:MAG: phosphonate ABC transporter ATP-binding protein [Bacteroidetes bacterium GWF2_42_66]|nr:MAG: phosphonate ABC transporter ATP-binding protein [Bacteroidetes bacterium GWA2_42_15]OFY03612.1 MAG: phosphonate ABC transporter ATP-binding protein [Bacteroidetes bacterium GWE2_42_39]OFY45977.1 MAG: phosphonate ABC transporter ATP-binding protein [Bacteroidetes bacterium GWF2_42_66]HBL75222.1 phosphonate ABC transporter ATP-binding protein [Prolixibacteraceae bacterium]HCR91753.1 phosphonate ABC transporter ATP-binding protein [Prolixibacteraceae bacterium]